MFPSAQNLILDVLKLNQPEHSNVRNLIKLGDFFNITENTIRVTLARLCKAEMIISTRRGFYTISARATRVEQELWNWRKSEQIVKDWEGHYIILSCRHNKMHDQVIRKKNQKALKLMGFAEFEENTYIRPANLIYTNQKIKEKLIRLGLTTQANIFTAYNIEASHERLIEHLWKPAQLNQYYIEHAQKMQNWMLQQHLHSQKELIQGSYLLCQDAIRHIFFDPLLPEPYINQKNRQNLIDTTYRFEINGIKIWRDYCQYENN